MGRGFTQQDKKPQRIGRTYENRLSSNLDATGPARITVDVDVKYGNAP
jgi:hypothetical protein